ncbi:MAG TPA: hypothetical protein VNZ57_03170, partial [Longimicrobiales bacterium]|nr:hypothetical protein [Longimicrobiales bacterium]
FIRERDRPQEILEDEILAISLPRRLGLTVVVESQIQRYEEAARHNQPIPADEAGDLLRLVLRRPDAESILLDAGRDIARRAFGDRRLTASIARNMPRAIAYAVIRRRMRKVLRRIVGRGQIRISGKPPVIRMMNALTAAVDASGTACVLYAAVAEELAYLYTRRRLSVKHSRCQARGDAHCEWECAEVRPIPASPPST